MQDRWRALGAAIIAARTRHGYRNRRAFARHSGLSERTLGNLERGSKTSYDPGTLAVLEAALHWQAGSVALVLQGRAPRPVVDDDLAEIHEVWPQLSPDARHMLARLARETISR